MKYLLALVGSFLLVNAYAQEGNTAEKSNPTLPSYINVEKGELQTNTNRDLVLSKANFGEIISQDSSGFYGWTTSSGWWGDTKFYLSHFDTKMNLTKQSEVEFKVGKKKLYIYDVKSVKGTIYAFAYYHGKGRKRVYCMQSINKETLQFNGDVKEMARVNDFAVSMWRSRVFLSKDESKILLYAEDGTPKKIKDKGIMVVMDDKANMLWSKSISSPALYSWFYDGESLKVDNDGNVYLLKISNESIKENAGDRSYKVIARYSDKGLTYDEFRINSKDKIITDLLVIPTNKGGVVCVGLYANEFTNLFTIQKGIYYFRADFSSKEVAAETYSEFDHEVYEQFSLKGLIRPKEEGLYGFDVCDDILRSDGGVVLLAEQSLSTQYNNNILTVNINPNGGIDWAVNISKIQLTDGTRSDYASFISLNTNGKIYLVYNDSPSNLLIKTGRVDLSTNAIVTLVEINADGTWNKYRLYSNSNKAITRPKASRQIGKNQLLLVADKHRDFKFIRVTIDK